MNFSLTVKFAETIFSQKVDGELVLLDMKTENYFGLDAVGNDIWQLLEDGNTLQETCDIMLEMYDVEPEQMRSDLESLVNKLVQSGLAELS